MPAQNLAWQRNIKLRIAYQEKWVFGCLLERLLHEGICELRFGVIALSLAQFLPAVARHENRYLSAIRYRRNKRDKPETSDARTMANMW